MSEGMNERSCACRKPGPARLPWATHAQGTRLQRPRAWAHCVEVGRFPAWPLLVASGSSVGRLLPGVGRTEAALSLHGLRSPRAPPPSAPRRNVRTWSRAGPAGACPDVGPSAGGLEVAFEGRSRLPSETPAWFWAGGGALAAGAEWAPLETWPSGGWDQTLKMRATAGARGWGGEG